MSVLPARVRNSDAALLFETFLLAAVVSFLGIRWFLALTGYPRVGGGGLHIAHMLWGGLLMLVALGALFLYLDRSIQRAAAVVAGIGFGTFVDEIGKFLTADNNYFFRPAVALIYVIFVALFLVARAAAVSRRPSSTDALANALDLLEEHLGRTIEPDDRARIAALLREAPPEQALTVDARRYLDALPARPDPDAWLDALPRRVAAWYEGVAASGWFDSALVAGVAVYTVTAVVAVIALAGGLPESGQLQPWSVSQAGDVLSTLAGAALVGVGLLVTPRSRALGFHWMLRGLLVWILVTQVFVFYLSQLAGLGGLVIDLVAYASLRYALGREVVAGRDPLSHAAARGGGPQPRPGPGT